jgi:hypothetical protein
MGYYSTVFDALEATVPSGSADRLLVESEVLGREIDATLTPGHVGEHSRGSMRGPLKRPNPLKY